MGDQIQLYSPPALLKLVPYYHKKKADLVLMFFRMNNARVFEACRSARQKLKAFINTPSFQSQFQSQFFTDNGTKFLFQKYNQASLYAMIEMARMIVQSLFDKTTQQGGKHAKSRRQQKKQKKQKRTRKTQGSTLWSFLLFAQKGGQGNLILRSHNPFLKQDTTAIQIFTKKIPYNAFLGVTNTEYVTQLLFQRALTSKQQEFLKTHPNELICIGLIFEFVQQIVPELFVIQAGKNSHLALQEGGGPGTLIKAAIFALLTSIPLTEVSTSFSQAMTPAEILKTNVALVSPTLTNAGQMVSYYDSGIHTAVSTAFPSNFTANLQNVPNSKWWLRPSEATAVPQNTKWVKLLNTVRHVGPSEVTAAKTETTWGQLMRLTIKENSICHLSEPIREPEPFHGPIRSARFDPGFIKVTRVYHSISASNQAAGEWAFLMVLDEKGNLLPNATITTSFERHSTIVPLSGFKPTNLKNPANSVMTWHFHPWDILDRINSHSSTNDFKLLVRETLYEAKPYQAAHAPEGVYIYSLQRSTLDAILSNIGTIDWRLSMEEFIEKASVIIDQQFINALGCEDFSTRQITSFENLGSITVPMMPSNTGEARTLPIPFGFEIRFYNQEDLSLGTPISLEYLNYFELLEPVFHKTRMAAVSGMTASETWEVLRTEIFSPNAALRRGVSGYVGVPAFSRSTLNEILAHHGSNIEPFVKILENPKLYLQFQTAVNRYVQQKGLTPEQIEAQFPRIMEHGLNPSTSSASSAAIPTTVFPWLVGLVGLTAAIEILDSLKQNNEYKANYNA